MLVNIGVEQIIETPIYLGEYADVEKQELIGEAEETHGYGIEAALDVVELEYLDTTIL